MPPTPAPVVGSAVPVIEMYSKCALKSTSRLTPLLETAPKQERLQRGVLLSPQPSKQALYEDLIGIQNMINVEVWAEIWGTVLARGSQVHFDQPAVNSGPNSLHFNSAGRGRKCNFSFH